MPKKNILLAMFDVRPAGAGSLSLEKLNNISKKIDLRNIGSTEEGERAAARFIKSNISSAEAQLINFFNENQVVETNDAKNRKLLETENFPELPEPKEGRIEAPIQSRLEASQKKESVKTEIPRQAVIDEFQKAMSEPVNITAELAKFGAKIYPLRKPKFKARVKTPDVEVSLVKNIDAIYFSESPRIYATMAHALGSKDNSAKSLQPVDASNAASDIKRHKELENFWKPRLASSGVVAMPQKHPGPLLNSPISRELETCLEKGNITARPHEHIKDNKEVFKPAYQRTKPRWNSWFRKRSFVFLVIIGLTATGAFGFFQKSGIFVKDNVIQNGNNAAANLKEAKQDLENFDFVKAADSFALAYDDFGRASNTLSQLGASFLSVFGNIPGLSKVKAANNLVEAGQSMSKAGENLSLAFATLYKSNLLSSFGSVNKKDGSLGKTVSEFKDVLEYADKNIKKADGLLTDIDVSVLPEDKRQTLLDFKEKIPEFQKYIGEAIDYSKFMYDFVGGGEPRKYIVLLQNNSELRATGGFPGTYALVEFKNGNFEKIFVDDIYQIDSNLKENIIPPIPMQHITPNWGMRDANWFADFPTSARKVEEFYKLDGGGEVNGVITLTPDIITDILAVVGPIDMPEYGVKLTADNFLEQVQEEVEYKADRSKPKKILTDFQPKFLAKLAEQGNEGWIEIFKVFLSGLKEKHILAYFNNQELQQLSVESSFAGEIKNTPADYLQVVFSNVKGSKTDFVTDDSFDLKISDGENSDLSHVLTINRVHKGGNSKFGFYNKDNSSYIRVYAPLGSKLAEIKGQSITDFQPLIGYEDYNFKKDADLESVEASISHPVPGVDVFEESGRTVFGFWLITKPGQSKSVTLKYSVPGEIAVPAGKFNLYWQKQSGTGADLAQVSYKGKVEQFDLSVDREFGVDTIVK